MGLCNYCVYKQIRERAKAKGMKVRQHILDKGDGQGVTGVDIYMLPKDFHGFIADLTAEQWSTYYIMRLTEVPESCECKD